MNLRIRDNHQCQTYLQWTWRGLHCTWQGLHQGVHLYPCETSGKRFAMGSELVPDESRFVSDGHDFMNMISLPNNILYMCNLICVWEYLFWEAVSSNLVFPCLFLAIEETPVCFWTHTFNFQACVWADEQACERDCVRACCMCICACVRTCLCVDRCVRIYMYMYLYV